MALRRSAGLLLTALAAIALVVSVPVAPGASADAVASGSISGVVYTETAGVVTTGTVTAMASDGVHLTPIAQTTLDSNGRFVLPGLPFGIYYLCASDGSAGFTGYQESPACAGDATAPRLDRVELASYWPNAVIPLTLHPWRNDVFSFTDGVTGAPVTAGVQVSIFESGTDQLAVPPFDPFSGLSWGLPDGSYDVEITAAGYPAQWLRAAVDSSGGWVGVPVQADSTPNYFGSTDAGAQPAHNVRLFQDGEFPIPPLEMEGSSSVPRLGVPATPSMIFDDFAGRDPATTSFQWSVDGDPVAGATDEEYSPMAADVGHLLAVTVTRSAPDYATTVQLQTLGVVQPGSWQFASDGTPTITGTALVGNTLTASEGVWVHPDPQVSYTWVVTVGNDSKAYTGSTLHLTAAMAAGWIQVHATASAPGYLAQDSNYTTPIEIGCPAFVAGTPVLSGALKVGDTVTVNPGTWSPDTTLHYGWMETPADRNYPSQVPAAAGPKLTITPALLGKRIYAEVSGTLGVCGYEPRQTPWSSVITAGTLTAATPTISGIAAAGQTLTAKPGTWTTGTALTYQWYVQGTAITGATKSTFKLTTAQRGKVVAVKVSGKKTGYASAVKTSAATGRVTAGLITGPTPMISGVAQIGRVLTVKPGSWSVGATLKYQWYAGTTVILGATKPTFAVPTADLGKALSVKVSGSRSGYTGSSRMSVLTAHVTRGFVSGSVPKILGVAKVGQILTASVGVWQPGTTLKFQWYRGTTAIATATGASYTIVTADVGKTIIVKTTGSVAQYSGSTKASAPTTVVAR